MTKAEIIAIIAPETEAVKFRLVTVEQMTKTLGRETLAWLEAKLDYMTAPDYDTRRRAMVRMTLNKRTN